MKTGYFFCGGAVIVDILTNRCSVINLQEDIGATHFPLVIPELYTVFTAMREPGDDQAPIEMSVVVHCDDVQVADMPVKFQFPKDDPSITRHRQTGIVQNLVLPKAGIVTFSLKRENETLQTYWFRVEHLARPVIEEPKRNDNVQSV